MNTVKVTRQEMIEALTRHDLEWLASGNARTMDLMDDCVKFFAEGGYSVWADKELFDLYAELEEDATWPS
jgi:hypothetical protein